MVYLSKVLLLGIVGIGRLLASHEPCYVRLFPDVMAAVRGAHNIEAAPVVCVILVFMSSTLISEVFGSKISKYTFGVGNRSLWPVVVSSLPCVAVLAGLLVAIWPRTSGLSTSTVSS